MFKKRLATGLHTMIFVSLCVVVNTGQANTVVKNDEVAAWVDEYVLASYQTLLQTNLKLQAQTRDLCNLGLLPSLDQLKPTLTQALEALAYSQAADGGPMEEELRNFQIYFWPDRNNLVNKQLMQMLNQSDFETLQHQGLEHASVALTGYPALEQIFFDPVIWQNASTIQKSFACKYIATVSDNLVRLTSTINNEWSDHWRGQLISPADNNSRFKTTTAQVSFVFTNVDVLLSKIIIKKLAKPLTKNANSAKPKRLESYRSSNSLIMLKGNVKAIKDSLSLVLKPALVRMGKASDWLGFTHQLDLIERQLELLPTPLVNYLNEPLHWQTALKLQRQFEHLQQTLRAIYPNIGVRLGFNGYDGD